MSIDSYYVLGKSGLRVSRLALGTMTFGTQWGWGSDDRTAAELLDLYLEAGGNFIDTADVYTAGTSETWLGRFIAERKARDRVVLATKFTLNGEPGNPNAGGNGRKNVLRAVEGSLRRLRTDYIDLYFMHVWDRITPADEVIRALDDLVRAGKIRHVGMSDVPAWYGARMQTLAELRGYEPVCALQLEYSLAERNIEREHVPLALELGMGVMVWSPLCSGLLSGKYRPGTAGAYTGDGRLQTMAGDPNPVFQRFNERNWEIVAELEAVATELARPMAAVALNWVANRPGVATVIVGATKSAQLEANLQALSFEIPPELLRRLDAIGRPDTVFPYTFFEEPIQGMINGGKTVGRKPPRYWGDALRDRRSMG